MTMNGHPSDDKWRIRPMALTDLPAVMDIEKVCHVEPWRERFFLDEMSKPHSRILVAVDPRYDKTVGYVCFWLVADEIQIFNLAVDITHRRRGIGRRLLLEALREGCRHGTRIALLEVRRGNDPARRLYQELGFKSVGIRPDYYETMKEPAVLMELEMNHQWRNSWLDHTYSNTINKGD